MKQEHYPSHHHKLAIMAITITRTLDTMDCGAKAEADARQRRETAVESFMITVMLSFGYSIKTSLSRVATEKRVDTPDADK